MTVRTVLVPAAVALVLTGCAAGQEQVGAPSTPVPASSSQPPSPSTATGAVPSAAAPTPTPEVRTVTVAYAGGEVTGTSGREQVQVGEQVVLRISSDVAEQVHVHGYDLEGAVPAGGSVDIPLTADIPGVFEVELHDAGKVLFQLRVA